ncbi:MAG: hypothetical protein HKN07_13950 [Acidimicrobiia bacterium]|nr:hypothetical protein [Acidimicrobiia bacterium]
MKRAVALLLLTASACSSTNGLNIYESSGLDEAVSLEIVVDGEDGSQQWMTVSEDGQVQGLAELLDESLAEVDADDCASTVTVKFYSSDASNQQLEVGCDRIRLARAAGEPTYAAPEFAAAIREMVSDLPSP